MRTLLSSSARTGPAGWPRARLAALVLALSASSLAACGDKPRSADTNGAAADSANADTSALAVARRQLRTEVRQAIPYTIQGFSGRFIAAALPVMDWVDDPLRQGVSVAPGGHEIVILEMPDTSATDAVTKPGLYVTDLPGTPRTGPDAPVVPDSNALRHLTGVDDMNGDGNAEVWSVQYGGPRHPYTWEIRAWDRRNRALYQLAAKRRAGGTGLDPESWDPSNNLRNAPAVREWLTRRLEALETQFAAADATAAGSAR